MARDRLFFRGAGILDRHGVPAWGLILQGVWTAILTMSGTYGELLDYIIFAALLFYVLTIAGVFKLRLTRPDIQRPYTALGYPFVPALYVVAAGAIMIDLLIMKPLPSLIGLGIVLTGFLAYAAWRYLERRAG